MNQVKLSKGLFLSFLFGLILLRGADWLSTARSNWGLITLERNMLVQNTGETKVTFHSNLDKDYWECNQNLFQRPDWGSIDAKDAQKVLEVFQLAANNPHNVSALRHQAELLWILGRRDAAISLMLDAVKIEENELNWAILGNFYSEAGESTGAINAYRQIDNYCRDKMLQANYLISIQENLNNQESEKAQRLIDQVMMVTFPTLCTSTYLMEFDNDSLQLEGDESMYSLLDVLPNNNVLIACLSDRLVHLVESEQWTEQDACDLSLLWEWYYQDTDNILNKLDDFCDADISSNSGTIYEGIPEKDLHVKIQRSFQESLGSFYLGDNRVVDGSFKDRNLLNWNWQQWEHEPLFPESMFLGGIVPEAGNSDGNALRIQGIISGPNIHEDLNRQRIFVGYVTNTGTLSNAQNQAYVVSLSYQTQNLRVRRPSIAIFDHNGVQIINFQLLPTEGEWHQIAIVFQVDTLIDQSRLGLLMPARGVVTYDQVALQPLTFLTDIQSQEQFPKRIIFE